MVGLINNIITSEQTLVIQIKKGTRMIIIAFSDKTSKILPHILCGKLKHCAPIEIKQDYMILHQFISHKNITKIKINMRDIKILMAHGWRFVYLPRDLSHDLYSYRSMTCVQFCKHAIGMKNIFIQTPNALFKEIK